MSFVEEIKSETDDENEDNEEIIAENNEVVKIIKEMNLKNSEKYFLSEGYYDLPKEIEIKKIEILTDYEDEKDGVVEIMIKKHLKSHLTSQQNEKLNEYFISCYRDEELEKSQKKISIKLLKEIIQNKAKELESIEIEFSQENLRRKESFIINEVSIKCDYEDDGEDDFNEEKLKEYETNENNVILPLQQWQVEKIEEYKKKKEEKKNKNEGKKKLQIGGVTKFEHVSTGTPVDSNQNVKETTFESKNKKPNIKYEIKSFVDEALKSELKFPFNISDDSVNTF
jgi:hypothetical protein